MTRGQNDERVDDDDVNDETEGRTTLNKKEEDHYFVVFRDVGVNRNFYDVTTVSYVYALFLVSLSSTNAKNIHRVSALLRPQRVYARTIRLRLTSVLSLPLIVPK